jgi:hypothetical protein
MYCLPDLLLLLLPVIDPVNGTDPITGTAEPGSTVTVTYPDGSTASDTSLSATVGATASTTAVAGPDVLPAGSSVTAVTVDPITGTAEPGSTVTVTYPDGSTASVVAGPDGTWT